MALPPCHYAFQFYVAGGRLSCMFHMRSIDAFLGLPFNIASYALLTHLIAQQCAFDVGELIWTGGDVHLYRNHIDQARQQLLREPMALPRLVLSRRAASLFDYRFEDIVIEDYQAHPHIKAPIAV
jgi:thymidylate synthase